ncbi:MAG: hypothetical protein APU95_03915 [Hadesarchaea archaeon YNP_N21]|nr:MAG: hypothetical protein APU95_03915 [Hadesarchaea archaeon YNP_N21]
MQGDKNIAKVERWLKENPLSKILLERSHLKPEILKTMLLFYWSQDATFEQLSKELKIQRPGAWKRWNKGRDAIIRSFFTIELAIYAGILDTEIAEILTQDLQDYVSLATSGGGLQELQSRIEERMISLMKIKRLPRPNVF